MADLHVKYLLIGGGPASSAAARSIRSVDSYGEMLWVSHETARPYYRPLLARQFIRREISQDALFTLPPTWFADNHVQLRTGRRVSSVDVNRGSVVFESGESIAFDQLLLATGATPKHLAVPGSHWPNVLYLRTIEDADQILHIIDKAKTEGRPHPHGRGRATVVGGGRMGVELAASLQQIGLGVNIVCNKPHLWSKVGGETTGKFVARLFESRGIGVYCDTEVARLDGDGRAQRVVLSSGESFETDFVVVAIGIIPRRELLRSTPIRAEKAILADARCRTSAENIFTAGDGAAVFDPRFGKHRPTDTWESAEASGRIAGLNMAGQHAELDEVTHFTAELFDLRLQSWGDAKFVHHRLVRGTPTLENPTFAEVGLSEDGRVAQVVAVGAVENSKAFAEMVRQRIATSGKAELIKDPSVPIESIL